MIAGWDIGGVNTKLALVEAGAVVRVAQRPFELQRDPAALAPLLRDMLSSTGVVTDVAHAVTMTAELSQMFRTKREGVAFVLDAVDRAFAGAAIHVYAVDGRFLTTAAARDEPLAVAAANWSATARAVSREHPDALMVDVGTTTTDIIPIVRGQVATLGMDDPSRLASGELVYLGALRTPVEAITSEVPIRGTSTGVSAESFALAGDVHVWRGDLTVADYSVPTPDGRPVTREFVAERLARIVCADREMLDERGISEIADAIAGVQVSRLTASIRRQLVRCPSIEIAVVTGLGSFLGERAARRAGLRVVRLDTEGGLASQCTPAASVATLLAETLDAAVRHEAPVGDMVSRDRRSDVDLVVKLGGSLLAHPDHLDAVLRALAAVRGQRMLIVTGGGVLADDVRDLDRRLALSDTTAHWMAVLAMDQLAHLVASRLEAGVLVDRREALAPVFEAQGIPVLAPYRWLRAEDPLPHSWDVTGDSISAWVAAALGALRLILVKAPGAATPGLTDPFFERAVAPGTDVLAVPADDLRRLSSALHVSSPGRGIFAVADAGTSP